MGSKAAGGKGLADAFDHEQEFPHGAAAEGFDQPRLISDGNEQREGEVEISRTREARGSSEC